MKHAGALLVIASLGCGTVLNGGPSTITPPPGATVNGVAGPVIVTKKAPAEIVYPDGQRCIIQSRINALYVVGDIVFFFVGLLVDAVTSDWSTLDAGQCPGVMIE